MSAAAATQTVAERSAAVAQIEAVPEPYGGKVLTRGHLTVGTVIALSPLMVVITGGVLIWLGTTLMNQSILRALTTGFAGFALIIAAVCVLAWYGDFLPSRYLYRLTRREFAQRPDCLVDPDDPEAIYVEIVPRAHWSKVMMDTASDMGFLKVDPRRREILFEGDKERYRIPAEAVESCDVEAFTAPMDQQGTTVYQMAVLRARTPDGLWEAPLSRRHIAAKKRNNAVREEQADELQRLMCSILPQRTAAPVVVPQLL